MTSFEQALLQFPAPPPRNEAPDEPDIEGGVRHLSISSDSTVESMVSEDENPTPPESPRALASTYHDDFHDGRMVASKDHSEQLSGIDKERTERPVLILPPPSPSVLRSGMLTPTAPSPLAARRVASGQLPNKALLSLQRMSFETPNAGTGLGVGPDSAGWTGMEGISPGQQAEAVLHASISSWSADVDMNTSISAFGLVMPPSSSVVIRHTPPTNFSSSAFAPDRSPLLRHTRGSSKPDFQNSPRLGTSPSRGYGRPISYHAPPSPLMRSSAFTYTNAGPLTPLTPSHVPGAPCLDSSSAFEWFDYSMPESPAWQTSDSTQDGESDQSTYSSNYPYRPCTPISDRNGHVRRTDVSRLPPSPLGVGRFSSDSINPFFAH